MEPAHKWSCRKALVDDYFGAVSGLAASGCREAIADVQPAEEYLWMAHSVLQLQ